MDKPQGQLQGLLKNKAMLAAVAIAAAAGLYVLSKNRAAPALDTPTATETPAGAGGTQTGADWPLGSERVDVQSYVEPLSSGIENLYQKAAETTDQIAANAAADAAEAASTTAAAEDLGTRIEGVQTAGAAIAAKQDKEIAAINNRTASTVRAATAKAPKGKKADAAAKAAKAAGLSKKDQKAVRKAVQKAPKGKKAAAAKSATNKALKGKNK